MTNLTPKYTQFPNVVLDNQAEMTDAEFRIVAAICRQTFGWHKAEDRLSLSQLEAMTGMTRNGVITGLKRALKAGRIQRRKYGQMFKYRLNIANYPDPASAPNALVTVFPGDPASAPNALVEGAKLVRQTHPQKKTVSIKKRDSVAVLEIAPPPADHLVANASLPVDITPEKKKEQPASPIAVWKRVTGHSVQVRLHEMVSDVLTSQPDEARLKSVFTAWIARGYNPTNVNGILEWYKFGIGGRNNHSSAADTPLPITPTLIDGEERYIERDPKTGVVHNYAKAAFKNGAWDAL